jgi:hypothetical protein
MTVALMLRLSDTPRPDDGLAGEVEVVANGERLRFIGADELLRLLHAELVRQREVAP